MLETVQSLSEKIFANNFDKQELLRTFNELQETDKRKLLEQLKLKLSPVKKNKFEVSENGATNKKMKAIDQRDLKQTHKDFIQKLVQEYEKFLPKSKKNVIKYQSNFVDQRRPFHLIKDLKGLHFQITYKNAEGSYVWDVDGNKYIDISGDMGVNLFGHKPKMIVDEIKNALERGVPLAGYSEPIFKAAKLFCEITGHERMLYTQSGTESVMFAIRIARAVTKKKKIVIFDDSFHGLSDVVVAIKGNGGESLPFGPGMLQEFADQIIVLDYGNMEQLEIIKKNSDEIAAVLVEPVQSRHPHNVPVEFMQELRKLTLEYNITLIFDEMITGFRICPKGAQGYFNIKADIATYGKIPGGGLPTGIVAGQSKYMDYVDGGQWNFEDGSMPNPVRTGMGGTHTQNPLKVSASLAVLNEIKKSCDISKSCSNCNCFQKDLNQKTCDLAEELNKYFQSKFLPIKIDYFGSLFRFRFIDSYWGVPEALFFILLRMNGIETNIQGNCFLTTAHSEEDIRFIIEAVKKSIEKLLNHDFFYEISQPQGENQKDGEKETDTVMNKTRTEKNPSSDILKKKQKLRQLVMNDLYTFQNSED